MHIVHVVSGVQKASGVTVFVEELSKELEQQGHRVTTYVHMSGIQPLENCDVVHVHGLWDLYLHKMAKMARRNGIPIVWSPHGMLQKWALKNKWWKKLAGLLLYQWWDLHSAALLHATAQSEVDDIRRLGLKNKVVVAPLGVRLLSEYARTFKHSNIRTLLFVSRVQRKKGLPNLIEAWSRLPEGLRKGWQVRVVGPEQDNHIAELRSLCNRLSLTYQDLVHHCSTSTASFDFTFTGPKYDAELAAEYDNADLFVLPTHSENFGSVVIEALVHGVPVVTTKQAPWAELVEFECGWWIDDDVGALTSILENAMALPAERGQMSTPQNPQTSLAEMGERGRKLVSDRYTWSAVCDKMMSGYVEVVKGGIISKRRKD